MSVAAPSRRAETLAYGLIVLVTLWRLALLAFDPPNLSFDEAQYWAWAQTLQLGYYSKPPLVAWVIAATTAMFGDGEGAVKLGSALAHLGTALVLVSLGRRLFGGSAGAWAGAAWISLPAVSLSSLVITTDPFLLLAWAAALLFLVEAERAGPGPNRWWVLLGLAFGIGLLAKYAMAFFVLSLAVWLAWDREARRLLRGGGPWLALGLGLLVYAPNGLWNAANGFVSYAHTRDNANLGGSLFHPDKLAEFVLGQAAVFGPILIAVLAAALVPAFRAGADRRVRLLAAFALPVLAVMTAESLLSRANANWTAPAYVAATLLVSAWLAARAPRLAALSVALHLAAAGLVVNLDALRPVLGLPDSARWDIEKRIKGWDEVGRQVSAILAAHPGARLLADERKVLATLTYYVRPHPFDAVKWNPTGAVRDHFDQTTRLEAGAAETIFVTEDSLLPGDLPRRFATVEKLADIHVPIHADYARDLTVWRLAGFKGYDR
ncbi:glycosyltransferase family 39 protein [Magnetospirillum sp. UT-4]|uniref:ArnT family glycosyltransferase n=1 Tax=Magnetospirillum sp. UT-4 TaxID=2681467 RepID=UPI00137C6813|nr:glycosyltransferase family 39 protein [Magnetospirillum sp. UT-4]CAA7611657.1 Transferase and related glycosyltransferases of PMT family [Magnetospirillum sp. UT-4]